MTTPIRTFGTDLSNNETFRDTKLNRAAHKYTKTPVSQKNVHKFKAVETPVISSTNNFIPKSGRTNGTKDYTVHFTAGPLGMQLEPVVKSIMGRDLGCKVVAFVDEVCFPQMKTSQARLANVISIGDVLVGVDGKQVLSKDYTKIISTLKASSTKGGRTITFRNVKGNEDFKTPCILPHAQESRDEISYTGSVYSKAHANYDDNRDDLIDDISVLTAPTSGKVEGDRNIFSPSNVKRNVKTKSKKASPKTCSVSKILVSDMSVEPKLSRTIDHIVRGIIPIAGTAGSFASNIACRAGKHASTKAGECLVGHSKKEFDNAIKLKHELLTELSCTKAALGQEQTNTGNLQERLKTLEEENLALKRYLEESKASKSLAENNLEVVREDLYSVNDRLAELEQQLRESLSSREKMEKRLDSSRLETAECQTEIIKLKQDIEIGSNEIASQKQNNESLTLQCNELNMDLERATYKFVELQHTSDKKIQALHKKCDHIENTKSYRIESLQIDLAKAIEALDQSQNHAADIISSHEIFVKKLKCGHQDEILSLNNKLKGEEQVKEKLLAEIKEVRMTSQLAEVAMKDLKVKLVVTEKKLAEEGEANKCDLAKATEALNRSQIVKEKLLAEVEDLRMTSQLAEVAMKDLKVRLAVTEKKLAKEGETNKLIRGDSEDALNSIQNRYEEKMQELMLSLETEQSKRELADTELVTLRKSIGDLEESKMAFEISLNTEKIKNDSIIKEFEELYSSHTVLHQSYKSLDDSMRSLQNKLSVETESNAALSLKIEEGQNSLQFAQSTIQQLKSELASSKMKVQDSKRSLELESNNQTLYENQINEVRSLLEMEKADKNKLLKENQQLMKEFTSIEHTLSREKNEHSSTLAELKENSESLLNAQNATVNLEQQLFEIKAKLIDSEALQQQFTSTYEDKLRSLTIENDNVYFRMKSSVDQEKVEKQNLLDELTFLRSHFDEQLSSKETAMKSLEKALLNERQKVTANIAKNQTLKASLDEMKAIYTDKDSSFLALTTQFEQMNASKSSHTSRLNALEKKYTLLIKRNENLIDENTSLKNALTFQERFDELVAEVDELVANFDPQILRNLRSAKDHVFKENEELSLQIKVLKQSLNDKSKSLEKVKHDLDKCNDALTTALQKETMLSNNQRNLNSELQSTEKRVYDTLNIIDERESTITNLNEHIETYQIQLVENERELEKIKCQAKSTIETLNNEISAKINEIHNLQEKMVSSMNSGENQMNFVLHENGLLSKRNSEIERDLTAALTKIGCLEKDMSENQEVEKRNNESIDALKSQRDQQIIRINKLMEQSDQNAHQLKAMESEKDEVLQTCEEKMCRVVEKAAEYDQKMSEMQQVINENEKELSTLQSVLRSCKEENDQLRTNLEEVEVERDHLQDRLNDEMKKTSVCSPNDDLVNEMTNQLNQTRRKLLELKKELSSHGMIPNLV